jgi:hypothetical protein
MSQEELALEAINLSKDWILWLTGISTAVIGWVFTLFITGKVKKSDIAECSDSRWANDFLCGGILSLAVSVSWASISLVGLPTVVQQIALDPGGAIYDKLIPFPFPTPFSIDVPFWAPLYFQCITFALGIFLIASFLYLVFVDRLHTDQA